MAGFNPSSLNGMKMPTWVTLKVIPDEIVSSARDLTQNLGTVLGRDKNNRNGVDQGFYIALMNGCPYNLTIGSNNSMTESIIHIELGKTQDELWIHIHNQRALGPLVKFPKRKEQPRRKPGIRGIRGEKSSGLADYRGTKRNYFGPIGVKAAPQDFDLNKGHTSQSVSMGAHRGTIQDLCYDIINILDLHNPW
uniref:Uncharacterized protein n=1 Tax=Physcomitrium patens TaxID=3218 RepID=A0A2K1K9T3_PHYPA|nr:hypothetical protein PHYPA_009723 [Physcomitrium patens]